MSAPPKDTTSDFSHQASCFRINIHYNPTIGITQEAVALHAANESVVLL